MYFYRKFDLNKYYFVSSQHSCLLVIAYLSYKIVSRDYLYLYIIYNYSSSFSYLILSKYFFNVLLLSMILYTSNMFLEVKIHNFKALSFYYWLGFGITCIRIDYYLLNFPSSAYSLVNTHFISVNILRRYLILTIY